MKNGKFKAVLVAAMLMAGAFSMEAKAEGLFTQEEMQELLEAEDNIASGTVDESYGQVSWVIDKDGKLTVNGTGDVKNPEGYEYWTGYMVKEQAPWHDYAQDIKTAELNVTGMTDATYLFYLCYNLTSVDLSNFDTSQVTDMKSMFDDCNNLTDLDLSNFDTSKVTDMQFMFFKCWSLTSLDLSSFDTSNVTYMNQMFYGCSGLESLDVSMFDTSRVKKMNAMFSCCSGLKNLNVSGFKTSNVYNMSYMFYKCSGLSSLDVSSFNTFNLQDAREMFEYCSGLKNLDLSNFDTSYVNQMFGMFYGCSSLETLDLSSFDMTRVIQKIEGAGYGYDMKRMLASCASLREIKVPLNCSCEINLPAESSEVWTMPDGTMITILPQNLTESITITKKVDVTKFFTDVSAGKWYVDAIQFVYEEGIMSGYKGKFTPNDTMTRAMIIQTLYRMSGEPKVTDYSKYLAFKDVQENGWYKDAVAWAVNEGITTGDTYAGTFNPNASVTREQLAAFLYRYSQYTGKDVTLSKDMEELLSGSDPSSWSAKEFAWSIDQGLISGIQKTDAAGNVTYDLAPKGTATRAQLATILQRYCEK